MLVRHVDSYFHQVDILFDKDEDAKEFEKYADIFLSRYFEDGKDKKRVLVEVKRGRESSLSYKGLNFRLTESAKTSPYRVALDSIMLLTSYLDVKNYERDVYPLHGAFVAKGKEGVLILGGSGAGKTTLSLNLLKEYGESGVNVVTSDKMAVTRKEKEYYVVGSTPKSLVRRGTLEELDLNSSDFEKLGYSAGRWDDYRILEHSRPDSPLEIKYAVLPKRGDHSLEVYSLPYESSVLRILEGLQHYIYDFPIYLIGTETPLPLEFPSLESRKKAIEFSKKFVKENGFRVVSGRVEDITKFIAGRLDEE